ALLRGRMKRTGISYSGSGVRTCRTGYRSSTRADDCRRTSSPGDERLPLGSGPLAHEFRAQHQPLDGFMPAIDFLGIVGQPDRADYRSLLQGLPGALDLQVLHEDDGIAVGKEVARGVTHLDLPGLRRKRGHFRSRAPLAGRLVIDIFI